MQEITAQAEKLIGIEVKRFEMLAVRLGKDGRITDGFKSLVDAESDTATQLISFINEARERFEGFDKLGIAVPGLLNRKTNQIAYSTRLPEIAKVDFLGQIEQATNLKLTIKNDANAAAFAEHIYGAGRGSNDMFYATIGRGIGGALIFDNKLWHGASGFAGEFGHIAINSEGMKLEDFASTINILRRAKNWIRKDSTTSLNSIEEGKITITDIVNAAENQDDFATLMLERTGTYIGTAIAGVINLLNIEKIVVGGEIMQAEGIVLNAIIQRAKELSFTPSFETVEIVSGELGEYASAIGVALLSDSENYPQ